MKSFWFLGGWTHQQHWSSSSLRSLRRKMHSYNKGKGVGRGGQMQHVPVGSGVGGAGQSYSSEKSGQSARPSHLSDPSCKHVTPSAHWKPRQGGTYEISYRNKHSQSKMKGKKGADWKPFLMNSQEMNNNKKIKSCQAVVKFSPVIASDAYLPNFTSKR